MAAKSPFLVRERNPDVLTSIANLSNDEVFTPPSFANQMLDTVEKAWAESNNGASIWEDKTVKFLDPFTKSGVFLREIVRRLNDGLAKEIPNQQERVNHILANQVFGMAITKLTALTARRSVYCSKLANGKHSIATIFDNEEGSIWFQRTEHSWVGGDRKVITVDKAGEEVEKQLGGKCKHCGASQSEYEREDGLETHAYALIHTDNPKDLIKETFGEDMQFDVIIGNPPYQLSLGNTGATKATAKAIYHEFVTQCQALDPKMLSMVIPSRWMTRSTKGVPDAWIDQFINDKRVRVVHDFLDSTIVFPGVDIKGGVCFFVWDRDNQGTCEYVLHKNADFETSLTRHDYLNPKGLDFVIREAEALSILEKIQIKEGKWFADSNLNFSSFVSPKDFFTNKELLTTNWRGYKKEKDAGYPIKYYLNKSLNQLPYGFISIDDIPKNKNVAGYHKVYIPASGWGSAMEIDDPVLGKPFVGEPQSVCSQTYLVVGYQQDQQKLSKAECENIVSYIETKFFRYLVSLKKYTQQASRGVYQLVPLQDFSKKWDDAKLYERYGLADDEIKLIESKIRAMGGE